MNETDFISTLCDVTIFSEAMDLDISNQGMIFLQCENAARGVVRTHINTKYLQPLIIPI